MMAEAVHEGKAGQVQEGKMIPVAGGCAGRVQRAACAPLRGRERGVM